MTLRKALTLCCVLGLPAQTACNSEGSGSGDATTATPDPQNQSVTTVQDLQLGDRSPEVVAVHAYLTQYGYYPNDSLASQYPAWRPVVRELPKDSAVFDTDTQTAVLAFQRNAGLPETGRIDAATRAKIATPRCGVVDNLPTPDPSNKYALWEGKWPDSPITWWVTNTDDISIADARDAAFAAFQEWASHSELQFQASPLAYDIEIKFAALTKADGSPDGPGHTGASAYSPTGGGDITLDTAETWTKSYVQGILTHEIGHSLGLDHSSIAGATMNPVYSAIQSTLETDDIIPINTLYGSWWQQLPGSARDIGVSSNGVAWIIGTIANQDGYSIHKWNESTWSWDAVTDAGANQIAVEPGGVPWVVNARGGIFRRRSAELGEGGWTQVPGCATDIGIGANGAVWIIGCAAHPDGHDISKWNGSSWDLVTDGGALAIAVGPTGVPWVVNSSGGVYRRLSSAAGAAGWQQLSTACGHDIGISSGDFAWLIGCTTNRDGYNISTWNEQKEILDSNNEVAAPARADWVPIVGGASRVSVGANSRPWLVNARGEIYRAAH